MRRLALLLACLVLPHAALASGPILGGIHVGGNSIVHEDSTSLALALRVPGVDGLLLNIGWSDIEPSLGVYTWDALDPWIDQARALGLGVTLSVADGMKTPAWLFKSPPHGAGATSLGFIIARKDGKLGGCDPDTIAAPWDPAFLTQWDAMLAALASHLQTTGRYDGVQWVRLTGIDRDSDELHLPTEQPSPKDTCITDAVATWVQAGYQPSRLLAGWDSLTTSFQRHFPDKRFTVAIIASTNPFPPIDDSGTPFTITDHESLSVVQNLPLLQHASARFPGRLVIQNNSLYTSEAAQPQTIAAAQSLGTMIAFQTNEDLPPSNDKRASCAALGDTAACDEAGFLAMLDRGVYPLGADHSLRAEYLEVFAANARLTPNAIQVAHDELVTTNPTAVDPRASADPLGFRLEPIAPNPSRPSTRITFTTPGSSHVKLSVYDGLGRRIATLIDAELGPGVHTQVWSGSAAPSGVYFVRLQAGAYDAVRRMQRVK